MSTDIIHKELTCLLRSNAILIVVVVFASKEKRKLGIIFLLLLRHLLKFRTVARHKICKLVNYVPQLQIYNSFCTTAKLTKVHKRPKDTQRV